MPSKIFFSCLFILGDSNSSSTQIHLTWTSRYQMQSLDLPKMCTGAAQPKCKVDDHASFSDSYWFLRTMLVLMLFQNYCLMFSTTYFCGYICGYIMDIFLCVFLPQLVQFFMQTIFARWKTHCSCTKTPSKVANLFLYATRVDNNLKDYVLFLPPIAPTR